MAHHAPHSAERRQKITGGADLIAAVATPPGAGGVGVIRVSGGDISPLAAMLEGGVLPPPRHAARQKFVGEDGRVIDDGLVLYFRAPRSFTGESVLELHAHGGVFVLRRLLARCLALGARAAEPGEFTLRAYLNGKMDLAQAEAVADLVAAGSDAAARAAAASLCGRFSAEVTALAARIGEARAKLECDLDFADDDTLAPDAAQTLADLHALAAAADETLRRARQGALLARGLRVVIAGAPNVGKSSLMNRLTREESSIVSPHAGTTRDVIERQITVAGMPVLLADVAGLRAGEEDAERQGLARARQRLREADIALSLHTADIPAAAAEAGGKVISVRNKIDLSGEAPGDNGGVIFLSAKTGAGTDALREALARAAGRDTERETPFLARARHLAALENAAALLRRAQADIAMPEVAAAWLRDAQARLGGITGGGDNEEDLLAEIFSRFCVGK